MRAAASVLLVVVANLLVAAGGARADELTPEPPCCEARRPLVDFSGYLQLWWVAREGAENGLREPWTAQSASDEASGFSIRRARLAADVDARWLRGRLELALEGSPRLMDAWAAKRLWGGRLDVWAGQMKVPSTYEVGTPSSDLDFATRSRFSTLVSDWTLCRSHVPASPFYGVRTYLRDLGVALKGQWAGFRYFAMVGNGLGANLYVGAAEAQQYVFANDLGAYLYAGRVSYDAAPALQARCGSRWLSRLELGGHYARNTHDNVVFNDQRTVVDIDRQSWSADVQAGIGGRLRLTGMVGAGAIEDDFDHDGRRDYDYFGWEAKVVYEIVRDRIELGVRYDVYEDEHFGNGAVNRLSSTTLGVTWTPCRFLRLRANYKWKHYDSVTDADLDDDVLLVTAQLRF